MSGVQRPLGSRLTPSLSATLQGTWWLIAGLVVALWGCGSPASTESVVHLVDHFDSAVVESSPRVIRDQPQVVWDFEDHRSSGSAESGTESLPQNQGWAALQDVDGLMVQDGLLVGRASDRPVLAVSIPGEPAPEDHFYALEVRMRVSAGTSLGASLMPGRHLPRDAILFEARMSSLAALNTHLRPGSQIETYTLTAQHALFETSFPMSQVRHVVLWPTDATDAMFEIASVRLITQREHLSSAPPRVGRYDLSGEVREGFATHARELVTFDVTVPADAFLDLAIGSPRIDSATFRVEAKTSDGTVELLRRDLFAQATWESVAVDLAAFGGRRIGLRFGVDSERADSLGFWGSPVIRRRSGSPRIGESTSVRTAVFGEHQPPPQGVILILADTLRRDHLQIYGYERPTAPEIGRLAREGVLFRDAIAQGPWTKVSVPSILTSLYPTTHGLRDMPDRLPDAVTTLAEVYREAGYATFATSSVPFTGRLSNLQQGFEVFLESSSLPELEPSASKTARVYVDRFLTWIEEHREVPFFALLHPFDPHSPYEPFSPYDSLWMTEEDISEHRQQMDQVRSEIRDPFLRWHALPTKDELDRARIDPTSFVAREKAWYDASIRAMDEEIGRLRMGLEELGLGNRTLVVLTSDHGEEFLEHGRHFHGYTAYGEMLNVPLLFWWPDSLRPGLEVAQTVQTIDIFPTLLEISGLPALPTVQGRSLLPLLAREDPRDLGWEAQPAFAERTPAPAEFGVYETNVESRAIIHDGWKLVLHVAGSDGTPERLELFRHRDDPLNLIDVSSENQGTVQRLRWMLDDWYRDALAARIEPALPGKPLTAEERDRLRSLGYLE